MAIPEYITRELAGMGYASPTSMGAHIADWWGWFSANNEHYTQEGRSSLSADHITIRPARLIAQEWASLLLNDKTRISVEDEKANAWIEENLGSLMVDSSELVETAFALGTGAWALRPTGVTEGEPSHRMGFDIETYGALDMVPLSFDRYNITECAFQSTTTIRGVQYVQLKAHVIEGGTYHIKTILFKRGERVTDIPDGINLDVDTRSILPTFAAVHPAIANTYDPYSPFGVSVFDNALGAVKLVDEAVDTMYNYLYVGKPLLFIDDSLIYKDPVTGKQTTYRKRDQQFFRKLSGIGDAKRFIEGWTPDLQITETREAVSTALQLLSVMGGFGSNYFTLDKAGGIKTATEVNADNSALFRNIAKHESLLTGSIIRLVRGAMEMCRQLRGDVIPESPIRVEFDDSIIIDTAAEKAELLAEIAAGVAQPWEYRVRFYGESLEEARENVAQQPQALDYGY